MGLYGRSVTEIQHPRPFLKWAGGKSRMLRHVTSRLPQSIGTYYEPFLGGGAVFFELARQGRFKNAVLSDANKDLFGLWSVIKNNVEGLIKELERPGKYVYEKDTYLKIRATAPIEMDEVKAAARILYLNKTCFNGLYRVNRLGEFNVPFGKYKNPVICDISLLRVVSKSLERVEILNQDFDGRCREAKRGDAVYFDPPYLPVSSTAKFTGYTSGGFGIPEHERLAKLFTRLANKGVRVVLSNSMASDAVRLFSGFDRDEVDGSRNVGGPADYRKMVKEMIVFAGPLGARPVDESSSSVSVA